MYNVLYIIYNEERNRTTTVNAKNLSIIVIEGNDEYVMSGFCGQRCHSIYMSEYFNRNHYSTWIDNAIRPMLCYENGDRYITFI